jgi:small-conductance mechanosensitive channel
MKKIVERIQEPTPKFFKKIRNIGLMLTAISGVIATAPISLPAVLVTIAGYLAVAGGIASAISQTAVYRDN